MLVKKFEAPDMATALKQVKDTLGADALILSTRTLSKKGLGVLGKQTIEVTAAIESPAMKASSRQAQGTAEVAPQPAARQAIPAAYRNRVELREDTPVELPKPEPRRVEPAVNPLEEELRSLQNQLQGQDKLRAEIDELKGILKQLTETPAAAPQPVGQVPVPPAPAPVESPIPRRQAAVSNLRPQQRQGHEDLSALLIERGIENEAAATIARFAAQQLNERQRQEPELCLQYLTRMVADLVQTSGPLWQPGEPQKRVALVARTGVGKTTTIAKLAAAAITDAGARVALVTIDTYRIAAVEQLKVYGEIMGLPVEVVLSPEQLQEAFRRHRDKDLILIDTAGRSPRDREQIEELNSFLGEGSGVENCLVLSASTAERLQQKTLNNFSRLPISRLIFTKLDETDQCGALINLPTRSNLPLAYLTNGQQVPEDLLLAEPARVAELVMTIDTEAGRIAV